MNNKKLYKNTFDKMEMSDEMFRKVMNMSVNDKKIRKFKLRFVTALATFAIMFALTNGIVYAATGTSIISKVTCYINGESRTATIKKVVNEDGSEGYRVSLEKEAVDGKVIGQTDGKIYLIVNNNLKKIEITEDLEDGEAKGEFELEGVIYEYSVKGDVIQNNVSIEKK